MNTRLSLLAILVILSLSAVCARDHRRIQPSDPVGPTAFCVTFVTDVNTTSSPNIVINVTRSWAPLGADRIFALMQDHFFDVVPAAFFRVVPQFVVQFGISGKPAENIKWNVAIPDDPVTVSNNVGTVTFATAGPNTRTTQIFINYADNSSLDQQGFAPFGQVVEGMDTALAIFNPTPNNTDGVDQTAYTNNGYQWIEQNYPGINSIIKATVVSQPCAARKHK